MTNCKTCGSAITENFCSHCGDSAKVKRIDAHYISHEVQHLLHLEKGFLYTVKELLAKPGESIKGYITGNRNKHVKPIPFLIFTSLLYTVISHYFHLEDNYTEGKAVISKSSVGTLLNWVQTHYGYANILMGGLIALWIKLFFRKHHYNIFEITVLLCFVMGQGMLLLTVAAIFAGLMHNIFIFQIMGYAAWLYASWAIGQFFDKKKAGSYIKAFLAYMAGTISFYIILSLVGVLYDVITH